MGLELSVGKRNTEENGDNIKKMVMDTSVQKMVLFTMVNGKMIREMDMEGWYTQMGIYTMENGLNTRKTV